MIFLAPDGIKGSSTHEGHKDEIEIYSFSSGISLPLSAGLSSQQRTKSMPNFQDITVSKRTDVASPTLMAKCAGGEAIPKVKLSFQRIISDKPEDYLVYELKDVLISSISIGGSVGDEPIETITLNFSTISVVYTEQTIPGKKAGNASFGWDLTTNQPVA